MSCLIAALMSVASLVLAIAIVHRFFPLSAKERKPGRPLSIEEPPRDVPAATLGRARARIHASGSISRGLSVRTDAAEVGRIGAPTTEGCLLLEGDGFEQTAPSGVFEIRIYCTLRNGTDSPVTLTAMRGRVYHASAGYRPIGRPHYITRYRVDVSLDKALVADPSVVLGAGEDVDLDLVLEASFRGDTGTTLVIFGIDFDLLGSEEGRPVTWRAPSDRIFSIQHWGPPYGDGARAAVNAADAAYLRRRYEEEKGKVHTMPDVAAAQTLDYAVWYQCTLQMLEIHSKRGIHRVPPSG